MPEQPSPHRSWTGPPDFACSRHDAGQGTVRIVVSGDALFIFCRKSRVAFAPT